MDLRHEGRILYVSSVDISRGNGPGVNEREFTAALRTALGDRATILVPRPTLPIGALPDGFVHSRSYRHVSHPSYLLHQLSQLREARRIFKSERFDLVIFRLAPLPLAQWLIVRRGVVPYAVKTLGSGVIDAIGISDNRLDRILAPVNDRLVSGLAKRAAAIDACTPELRHHVVNRLGIDLARMFVVENATNTRRFQPTDQDVARQRLGLDNFHPIIGYIGGSPWERGGRDLVDLARSLNGRYPTLGVLVVGGDSDIARLKAYAADRGVAARCVILGQIPYEEVSAHINALDIGISLDRPERMAAIGNSSQKVRQYVACGKPVIAGPIGNSFLSENGLGTLVEPGDLDGLALAVEQWVGRSQQQVNDHSAKAAKYAVENLSVERRLADRLDVWNQSLASLSD